MIGLRPITSPTKAAADGILPDFFAYLSVYGAKKNTAFVGKYLTDNFKLTDHRGDKEFSQWNKDYKIYSKKIKKLK